MGYFGRKTWVFAAAALIIAAVLAVTQPSDARKEETVPAAEETAQTAISVKPALDVSGAFTERDMEQSPSLENAVTCTVSDQSDIHITEEGIYVLSGTAVDATVYVEADKEAKVQLVLSGLNITNRDFPCIYVISGDKVFVTTDGESTLTVKGEFRADGDTKTNGVIFSRSDLVFNGTGTLNIESSQNAVVTKDGLKVTGGTYIIRSGANAMRANNYIFVAGGNLDFIAGTDGLHAEHSKDDALGHVYITDAAVKIQSEDDAIHATAVVQIDGGTVDITDSWEGIEGTCIQINGGTVNINGRDDCINGNHKSSAYTSGIEINGGELNITATGEDNDGIDTNGNLTINGGIVTITGPSPIDCNGKMEFNGGTVIINGEEVTELPNFDQNGKGNHCILRRYYGDYMELSPEKEQVSRQYFVAYWKSEKTDSEMKQT